MRVREALLPERDAVRRALGHAGQAGEHAAGGCPDAPQQSTPPAGSSKPTTGERGDEALA